MGILPDYGGNGFVGDLFYILFFLYMMNKNTEQLIRELSDKLGTTAEHLWGVLMKQAFISGVTDVITYLVLICLLWLAYRFVKQNTTKVDGKFENPINPDEFIAYSKSKWGDDLSAVAWLILCLSALFIFL